MTASAAPVDLEFFEQVSQTVEGILHAEIAEANKMLVPAFVMSSLLFSRSKQEETGVLVLGGYKGKVARSNEVSVHLREIDADAAVLCNVGHAISALDDVEGMPVSINPRHSRMVNLFGVSRNEELLVRQWVVSNESRNVKLNEWDFSDELQVSGRFVAALLQGIQADVAAEQFEAIARGVICWPKLAPVDHGQRKTTAGPKRNELCNCGSGKKAKRCCHA